jgi:DNA-directed RNA polymerase II subunit RPB2
MTSTNQELLISQDDINQLIRLYFKQPNILYDHLFSSFHQLVEEIIPYSLCNENNYFHENIDNNVIYLHGFKCSNVRIKPPTNPSNNELLSPKEARTKHLKYFATIIADVIQFVEKEDMTTGDKTITMVGETEKDVNIANIPIMIKSKYCSTYIKNDMLGECKHDPGGYFIVNGKEKIVMSIEKMVDNKILVFSKTDPTTVDGKTYLAHINSRQDDWSDNLQIITIKNRKNGDLVFSNSQFSDIPLFIIMRALGLESDMDIISNCAYNLEDVEILNILRPSIIYSLDEVGVPIKTKEEAYNYLITKLKRNKRISQNDEALAAIQKRMYLDKVLRKDLLPHLGEDVPKKIRFLGLMANKLLLVLLKRRQVDDRDGFDNKRVETPGVLLGQLFRQNWKKLLNEISKNFKRKNQSDEKPINMINQIKASLVEQGIKTALSTGIWGMNRTKKGVAQSLMRLSWVKALSDLRRIMSPSLDASTQKVTSIRHVNNITYGFICPVQTPEGQKIGIVKSLSMMSTITNQNVAQKEILDEIMNEFKDYTHPYEIDPLDMNQWSKIIFNGNWIGCTKSIYRLYTLMIQKKNNGILDKLTSICMDYEEKELRVYYDAGRLVRPLINVKNNIPTVTLAIIKEVESLLKTDSIKGWNILLSKYPNIIGYEDIESAKFIMSAEELYYLKDSINNMNSPELDNMMVNRYGANRFIRYTHLEFHRWIILGEIACGIPFANHNYGTKNIINFSQSKQGIGLYLTSYKDRMDISQVLYHPQIPLVTTEGMNYNNMNNLPAGENLVVAIMSYTGYNQEDSLIFNQSAIDRGILRVDSLKTYHSEIEKNPSTSQDDVFIKPDRNKVTGMKQGNYDKLNEKGFVPEETEINNEDIIIGKVSPIQPTGNNNKVYKDSSEIFKSNVPGVVDRVHTNIFNSDGYEQYNMRVRMERVPVIGDKFACYDDSHDVLTTDGWVNIRDITTKHMVACLKDENTLIYSNPTEVQSYDYEGQMYLVESNQVSLCVTPNHRMWVGNRNGQYKIEEAKDIFGKRKYYMKNVDKFNKVENKYFTLPAIDKMPEIKLEMKSWLLFFGIWIAEGCVVHKSNDLRIATHKQRVKDAIDECNKVLNFDIRKYTEKGCDIDNDWRIYNKQIVGFFKPLSVNAPNKSLPEWVWELSREQCIILIEGMLLGDGHTMANGTCRYDTSSTKLADDFQRLCLHAGWSCNKVLKYDAGHVSTIVKGDRKGETITSRYDAWRLTIIKSQNTPLVNKNINEGKQLDSWIENKDDDGNIIPIKVYCCSVPSGIIYVRRNGIVVWCGQSRHGQKGTLGIALPQKDMPFTEEGMVPDIIFNPHGIPSRMTVAQLIETMVSKIGAIDGKFMDGTPFSDYDIRDLPNVLKKLGYSPYGTETMYCGMTGKKIETEIFIGPVYYMRLKHLVLDKVHSRARGPRQALTRQPLDGRARAGGLKVGEHFCLRVYRQL